MTSAAAPARNSYFVSPSTGVEYFIGDDGLAVILPASDPFQMCECEQDWNCPLHGGTDRPTWIESRFDFMDDGDPYPF